MKFAVSVSLFLVGLLAAHAAPPDHARQPRRQPPPTARGHYRRFEAPANGRGRIDLFAGGPTIDCDFHPGRGRGQPRECVDGATAVTMVDADCPESGLFHGNPNRKCFAASISEGSTGKIYTVNSAGEVSFACAHLVLIRLRSLYRTSFATNLTSLSMQFIGEREGYRGLSR